MAEAVSSMAVRYLGSEDGRAYAETAAVGNSMLVRVEPGQIRGWDFADEIA
jgi:hypothetical protein